MVITADGPIALVEPRAGDDERIGADPDPFRVDAAPRPFPMPVHSHSLSVLRDGELACEVSWLPVLDGPTYGCLAWVIGVTLMPQFRRRGIGTAAHALLVAHLFVTTDVDRIEAETDVDNASERRVLEKSGFTLDGVLRGAQLRGGRRHDLAVYSRLRSDPSP